MHCRRTDFDHKLIELQAIAIDDSIRLLSFFLVLMSKNGIYKFKCSYLFLHCHVCKSQTPHHNNMLVIFLFLFFFFCILFWLQNIFSWWIIMFVNKIWIPISIGHASLFGIFAAMQVRAAGFFYMFERVFTAVTFMMFLFTKHWTVKRMM